MKRPDFTNEEQFVVDYYRNYRESGMVGEQLWQFLGYTVPALVFVVWGMLQNITLLVCTGFALMLFFKASELFRDKKWGGLFGSIFQKYEEAFASEEEPS